MIIVARAGTPAAGMLLAVLLAATVPAGTFAQAAGTVAAPDASLLVLPGTVLSERTTLADLQARFGAENIQLHDAATAADAPDAILFPDDPARRALVWFWDGDKTRGIARIRIDEPTSLWRGKHGVRIGMSLAEVQALNGKPFGFTPSDPLPGGSVRDQWSPALDGDDGALGAFDVGSDEQMYFDVDFGPRPGEPLPAGTYPGGFDTVRSDDPRYPLLGESFEVTAFGAHASLDDEW